MKRDELADGHTDEDKDNDNEDDDEVEENGRRNICLNFYFICL